ncbi:MAG: ornithine carbamoyltransferase [bacterium]|nr:ornithine carbamoyltransferase [bacterium]
MKSKDFLSMTDWTRGELDEALQLAIKMKAEWSTEGDHEWKPLRGKTIGCIFHKPSLRTRISFETGIYELGGYSLYITEKEIELGKRETIEDAARVLTRYLGGIVIRTFSQNDIVKLAQWADVPVINALTDLLHPCQLMADLQTILEHKGTIDGLKIAYLGDGNNMANSWIEAANRWAIDLRIGTSPDTLPDVAITEKARREGPGTVTITHDPVTAVQDCDVVYTDVWASMGAKDKADINANRLQAFQVNTKLMSYAKSDAIVMHCLPAERGREITDEVIESKQSVVFDEAENRLHAQKAILAILAG